MTTEQLAVIVTGVVGVAGISAPTLTAWRQRVHERRLSRAERLFRARSDTYADAASYLRRERLYVERTLPVIEMQPALKAPPALNDDEWARVLGRVAVHASRQTLDALEEARIRVQRFGGAVVTHRLTEQQAQRQSSLAEQVFEMRRKADEARERAYTALDEAERVMRDELANL